VCSQRTVDLVIQLQRIEREQATRVKIEELAELRAEQSAELERVRVALEECRQAHQQAEQ